MEFNPSLSGKEFEQEIERMVKAWRTWQMEDWNYFRGRINKMMDKFEEVLKKRASRKK